ncbi:hypothetical protein [Streptomyces griseoloalbus]|uniref:DNA-binding MarR family transcriptional regulator n=1 Tax=Streptomyces griseoloalbus TaxID=67303 RepID=A0A7W8FB14_9ACTN|nr:hypothetical protein [Streptomyces albaduncus]MBB5128822.1 DNA-binding MarR family transcriptional regulator [Streptomyces albaduncus]
MHDLAERVRLGQASVTRIVARLDVAGSAVTDLCPSDARGVCALITDEGRARFEAARSTYADVLPPALDRMGNPGLGSGISGCLVKRS